jgi:hypothetical protein
MVEAPKIDGRTGLEIARQVYSILPSYVENWPDTDDAGELSDALIHVFARFGEIIIDRLNNTPTKNFFAFLDLLGVSPLPLQAARAPITFYLAAGNVGHAVVPAGTQIAAPPAKGEQKPVIFETEKELVLVSAKLESLFIKDGRHDRYTDFDAVLTQPAPSSGGAASDDVIVPPLTGKLIAIPHVLYVPLPAYAVWPALSQTRLNVVLDDSVKPQIDRGMLQWELCVATATTAAPGTEIPDPGRIGGDDAISAVVLQPSLDETESLTKSGDIVFSNLPPSPSFVVGGVSAKWLRCRLLAPITALPESTGMVLPPRLPRIKTMALEIRVERTGLSLDQAVFNSLKLDLTKDFFPFGEKPKFGDTLYMASREAFSSSSAVLNFHFAVTNPKSAGADTPFPAAKPQNTKLQWEFWDGNMWSELGTSDIAARRIRIRSGDAEGADTEFSDSTQVFSESGDVSFKFPKAPARLNLNGQDNYWIRVRIIAGDYGREAHYEHREGLIERELKGGVVLMPATFAPPSIRSISIDYSVTKESHPDSFVTYNDFAYLKINPQVGPFHPFVSVPSDELLPTLYFGFTLPPSSRNTPMFPHRAMSLYVGMPANVAGQAAGPKVSTASWEYWNGANWKEFIVLDETQGLRRAGLIRFLAPSDLALSRHLGETRYWLRMRRDDPDFQPQFFHVLLNTVMAVQGATIANEILGASNETPSQQFRTTQWPVLEGQKVEVCEPTKPSFEERARIRADEGDDAIMREAQPTGKGDVFWIRWHEVPNFYGSGPRDRHYLLDRTTGALTFGDGTNGMIPPVLRGNIRSTYRTGGGTAGNQPAGSITQIKSAIPYIQKAMNFEAASGGTDAEPDAALLSRGPLGIRHGGRVVTREDFEDLAMLATREVARAKCVPLFDLTQDPNATKRKPGAVSLIIVPRSTNPRPQPSLDLLDRVRGYIDARRQLTADLALVGPEYVRVDVECEITVFDPETANDVELAVRRALDGYLDPLTGGDNGTGWDFGREPQRSDFFGLLVGIAGVSHIRELGLKLAPDRPGSENTDRFLICCGKHKITTTLED